MIEITNKIAPDLNGQAQFLKDKILSYPDRIRISGVSYYVSSNGNDENDGTEKSPVATLEKAVSLAKSGEKTAICLYAGKYSLLDTLCIEKSLSGSPEFPFIFTSVGNGEVCISTSTLIDFSDFSPIEADDEIAARLPEIER